MDMLRRALHTASRSHSRPISRCIQNAAHTQNAERKLTDALKCFYWSELIWFIFLIGFPLQLICICMPITPTAQSITIAHEFRMLVNAADGASTTSTAHLTATQQYCSQKPDKWTKNSLYLLLFEILFRPLNGTIACHVCRCACMWMREGEREALVGVSVQPRCITCNKVLFPFPLLITFNNIFLVQSRANSLASACSL